LPEEVLEMRKRAKFAPRINRAGGGKGSGDKKS